jgi:hypothetical protein
LDVLQSTGAHGRSGQLAESHPQGSACGARAATSVHVSSEGEGGTKPDPCRWNQPANQRSENLREAACSLCSESTGGSDSER